MRQIRALGFTPVRAAIAACTLAGLVGGGLAISSGPAQTEGSTKISLYSVANATPPGSADHSALEEAARAAAVQKLAEAMKKRAAKDATTLASQAPAAAGQPGKAEIASTTTGAGSAASATITRQTPTDAASTTTSGGAKVSATVTAPVRVASISPEDMQRLAGKAAAAIRTGDIASARLVLEHAARAGDATALYALAETYDPRVLAKLRVQGMTGDVETARQLYRRALDSGVEEARGRLSEGG